MAVTLQLTIGPQNVRAARALKLDNVSCTSASSYPIVMFGNELLLVCLSLGKMISLSTSLPWLPRALCAGLKPCDLSHVHFGVFIDVALAQIGLGSQVSEALSVQVRHRLTENSLVPWFL